MRFSLDTWGTLVITTSTHHTARRKLEHTLVMVGQSHRGLFQVQSQHQALVPGPGVCSRRNDPQMECSWDFQPHFAAGSTVELLVVINSKNDYDSTMYERLYTTGQKGIERKSQVTTIRRND